MAGSSGRGGALIELRPEGPSLVRVEQANRQLRIAMIGTRGVPATFGGVEHHVEELGSRLAARGHEVTVFSRTSYVSDRHQSYRGLRVRHLPALGTKHLEAMSHSVLSTLVALFDSFDVLHYHALGPGMPAILARYLSRAKIALTVHGLDSERIKWNRGARSVLKGAEWLSARVPDATIVVSRSLADYYSTRHRRNTWYIPNGVNPPTRRPAVEIKRRLGLEEGKYVLFVGRMVPEKAPHLLIKAFRELPGDLRLVMTGGSSYTDEYLRSLHQLASSDPRVMFLDYIHGPQLDELYSNAAVFVLPSTLEGLPLTLLEAASYGTPVLASDIPPHIEVIKADGPGHRFFAQSDQSSLVAVLRRMLANPSSERAGADEFRQHVLRAYRWEDVVDATETMYQWLTKRSVPSRASGFLQRSPDGGVRWGTTGSSPGSPRLRETVAE